MFLLPVRAREESKPQARETNATPPKFGILLGRRRFTRRDLSGFVLFTYVDFRAQFVRTPPHPKTRFLPLLNTRLDSIFVIFFS